MIDLSQVAYCPFCGARELARDARSVRCTQCDKTLFQNASAAVGVVLRLPDGRVLMSRRAHEPARGKLDFPGGFVDAGEDFETAAVRELREELGIAIDVAQLRYVCSNAFTYPYNGVTTLGVDVHFVTDITPDVAARCAARDDVAEIVTIDPRDVTPDMVAFPGILRVAAKIRSL